MSAPTRLRGSITWETPGEVASGTAFAIYRRPDDLVLTILWRGDRPYDLRFFKSGNKFEGWAKTEWGITVRAICDLNETDEGLRLEGDWTEKGHDYRWSAELEEENSDDG